MVFLANSLDEDSQLLGKFEFLPGDESLEVVRIYSIIHDVGDVILYCPADSSVPNQWGIFCVVIAYRSIPCFRNVAFADSCRSINSFAFCFSLLTGGATLAFDSDSM